jgi:hypothetical protein
MGRQVTRTKVNGSSSQVPALIIVVEFGGGGGGGGGGGIRRRKRVIRCQLLVLTAGSKKYVGRMEGRGRRWREALLI